MCWYVCLCIWVLFVLIYVALVWFEMIELFVVYVNMCLCICVCKCGCNSEEEWVGLSRGNQKRTICWGYMWKRIHVADSDYFVEDPWAILGLRLSCLGCLSLLWNDGTMYSVCEYVCVWKWACVCVCFGLGCLTLLWNDWTIYSVCTYVLCT